MSDAEVLGRSDIIYVHDDYWMQDSDDLTESMRNIVNKKYVAPIIVLFILLSMLYIWTMYDNSIMKREIKEQRLEIAEHQLEISELQTALDEKTDLCANMTEQNDVAEYNESVEVRSMIGNQLNELNITSVIVIYCSSEDALFDDLVANFTGDIVSHYRYPVAQRDWPSSFDESADAIVILSEEDQSKIANKITMDLPVYGMIDGSITSIKREAQLVD